MNKTGALGVEKTFSLYIESRWPKDRAEPLVRALLEKSPDMELLELIDRVEQELGLTLSMASACRLRQQCYRGECKFPSL